MFARKKWLPFLGKEKKVKRSLPQISRVQSCEFSQFQKVLRILDVGTDLVSARSPADGDQLRPYQKLRGSQLELDEKI